MHIGRDDLVCFPQRQRGEGSEHTVRSALAEDGRPSLSRVRLPSRQVDAESSRQPGRNLWSDVFSRRFFSAQEKRDFRMHVNRFSRHFQFLAHHATRKTGQLLWHVTPKLHWMCHLPDEAELLNPRFTQCYLEEGLIGTSCRYSMPRQTARSRRRCYNAPRCTSTCCTSVSDAKGMGEE